MNSRRISGEIYVDRELRDVWAILTDYDYLSTHVPNLVESYRVDEVGRMKGPGRCRLYQKGAQKIAGFEFGASVTMDMEERFYDENTNMKLGVVSGGGEEGRGLLLIPIMETYPIGS